MPECINARVSRYYICWHSITIICYTFVQQLEICNENIFGVELWKIIYFTVRCLYIYVLSVNLRKPVQGKRHKIQKAWV